MKSILARILQLATMVCLATSAPAKADTIIRKSTTYFSISGNTAEELDREMLRRGPLSKTTGHRHPGATQIRFSGAATFVNRGSRCHIGGAKVTLNTRIILPRWKNRRKAGARLALIWDTLASDIKRHEERHAEIARNHAKSLERAILALPAAGDCKTLRAKVNKLSSAEMAAHEADQMRFDRIEAVNFEKRMLRLLRYRLEARRSQ
jgi:predicted secreted Zn-dependent protease